MQSLPFSNGFGVGSKRGPSIPRRIPYSTEAIPVLFRFHSSPCLIPFFQQDLPRNPSPSELFNSCKDRCVVPIAMPNFEAPLKERKAVGRSWYVSNFRNAFSFVRSDQSVVLWVSYRPSCHSRNEMTNEQAHPQVKEIKEKSQPTLPPKGQQKRKEKQANTITITIIFFASEESRVTSNSSPHKT